MESSAMRANYPEAYQYLKAKKDRHPREDAVEDYTQWTLMGVAGEAQIPKPGHEPPAPAKSAAPVKKEETEEEYVSRRCEEYMHKSLSSRRGQGGKFFTIGGGGDGGVSFQVL